MSKTVLCTSIHKLQKYSMTRTLNWGMSCGSCTHIQAFCLRCLSKEIIYHQNILGTPYCSLFNFFMVLPRALRYKMYFFAFILCRWGYCFKWFFWSIISLNLIGNLASCNRIKFLRSNTKTKRWLSLPKYSTKINALQSPCDLIRNLCIPVFCKWIPKLKVKQI